jgi:hypothetical protein
MRKIVNLNHPVLQKLFFGLLAVACSTTFALATDLNLQPFNFTFNNPIGIDFHEPTGQLIMSVNYPTGVPNNLNLVDSTTGAPSVFSALAGLTEELKIATVRASNCQGGFTVGEVFTGNGTPGQVVRISANGTVVQNPWVTLPGEPALIRGSLFQDRFCAAGGDLIVVTGNEQLGNPANDNVGNVWRVTSAGVATKVATINRHLEGVETLPNDILRYGPLAGKILAGDEDILFSGSTPTNGPNGKIWVVDPNTGALFTVGHNAGAPACVNGLPNGCNYTTGTSFNVEDLDLIRQGADFFGVAFSNEKVFVTRTTDQTAANFRDRCGQLLITQERPFTGTSGLYALRFSGTDSFIVDPLTSNQDGVITQWEHVTFTSGSDCAGGQLETVTQGGWGAPPHGDNPGTILRLCFTGGTVVVGNNGGPFTLTFTSPDAITDFLPQGGKPSALTASAVDPGNLKNVFSGQVLALALNVKCSSSGFLAPGLGSFVLTSGPAAGKTVDQVLADANKALGGGGLPSYVTSISDLNDIVDSINEMFD